MTQDPRTGNVEDAHVSAEAVSGPGSPERLGLAQSRLRAAVSESQAFSRSLHQAITDRRVSQAVEDAQAASKAVSQWSEASRIAQAEITSAMAELLRDLAARSDLITDVEPAEPMSAVDPGVTIERLLGAFKAVARYDAERAELRDQLERGRAELSDRSDRLAQWSSDAQAPALPGSETGDADVSLRRELSDQVSLIQKALVRTAAAIDQHRGACVARIRQSHATLKELGVPDGGYAEAGVSTDRLHARPGAELSDAELRRIEASLRQHVSVKQAEQRSTRLSLTASALLPLAAQGLWDDQLVQDLSDELGRHGYDLELTLLHLASGFSGLRVRDIELNDAAASALSRGCQRFMGSSAPFDFLSLVVKPLLGETRLLDPLSQARWCLMMIGAQQVGAYAFSPEALWTLPIEWPLAGMPSWSRIWQLAVNGEPIPPIISADLDALHEDVQAAQNVVNAVYALSQGKFYKLTSLQSDRHKAMLDKYFVKDFATEIEELKALHAHLLAAGNASDIGGALSQLEHKRDAIEAAVADKQLKKDYERAVSRDGILESRQSGEFHRRTSLSTLEEYAHALRDFARSLARYWRAWHDAQTGLMLSSLGSELDILPDSGDLARRTLDLLAQAERPVKQELSAALQRSVALEAIAQQLLLDKEAARHLPRVVAGLTAERRDFDALLASLLEDLSDPPTAEMAAGILIAGEAPAQALLLADQTPADIQKRAQTLQAALEREMSAAQNELIKAGVTYELDISRETSLGRWRALRAALGARLAEYNDRTRKQQEVERQQRSAVRKRIHAIEEALDEAKTKMPGDAYSTAMDGLERARRALDRPEGIQKAADFATEMDYRLARDAWLPDEMRRTVAEFDRFLTTDRGTLPAPRQSADLIQAFATGDIGSLGIRAGDITDSEMATRLDALRRMVQIKAIPTGFWADQSDDEKDCCRQLFSVFGRMMAMERSRGDSGKGIVGEDDFYYELWRLQFPKTAVLNAECVFIALCGLPDAREELTALEALLERKRFLDDYFVFLFAPGLTDALRKGRLNSYRKRGLVIIEERELIKFVLAETEGKTPLALLRPSMISSKDAQTVDVFKVNQSVEPTSSIFVGRDTQVNKLSSAGDNYAVYGGRRIGKSSLLAVAARRLEKRPSTKVVMLSIEGESDCSDDALSWSILRRLDLPSRGVSDFKELVQKRLEEDPALNFVLLIDEIDRYINDNPRRHVLIESMRALSDRFGLRFRVIVAGFMRLYDCLKGRGPYSPSSDPWSRMFNPMLLDNLRANKAEEIIREGFGNILGWRFTHGLIPQRIVERTGGHPAFVQDFCLKLQDQAAVRDDKRVTADDVDDVYHDPDPNGSFIAYVRSTLELNLDPLGHYLILFLAREDKGNRGFTVAQASQIADSLSKPVPAEKLQKSLDRLVVTSVVRQQSEGVYKFSVPDYPAILQQLGETNHLDRLENDILAELGASNVA
jgi:hypothetical protein